MLSKSQQNCTIYLAQKLGLKVSVASPDRKPKNPHVFGNAATSKRIDDFKDFLEFMDKIELAEHIKKDKQ